MYGKELGNSSLWR